MVFTGNADEGATVQRRVLGTDKRSTERLFRRDTTQTNVN